MSDAGDRSKRDKTRFGSFGGRYVAEALWTPLERVAEAFEQAASDEGFLDEFDSSLDRRLGRPTPLTCLARISEHVGGGTLWLKREDLCVGQNFTPNLAIAYALLARRMGCHALVGESATGEFGVALGAIGNALGMKVRVYMGREDQDAEPANIEMMRALGVKIITVDALLRGRKLACSEALRYWATHSDTHFYCPGSLAAPDPYPRISAFFLSVIGAETRAQVRRQGWQPDYIIAPVGSGGFAAGLFSEFILEDQTQLVGVQGAGEGLDGRHAASLVAGRPGVFQGTKSYLLQDPDGQVLTPASAAAGLSMPNVGPQHARWAEQGRVLYVAVQDAEAFHALDQILEREGLLVSLEAGHALAYALKLLPTLDADQRVVVGISGGGYRDLARFRKYQATLKPDRPEDDHE